jgi:hypothetical protein
MTGRKKPNLGNPKIVAAPDGASEHDSEKLRKQKRGQNGHQHRSREPPRVLILIRHNNVETFDQFLDFLGGHVGRAHSALAISHFRKRNCAFNE